MPAQDRTDWPFPYEQQDAPRDVVIVARDHLFGPGTGPIAYECLTRDSPYEVVAFAFERRYLAHATYLGLPAVPFEEVDHQYPPDQCSMFVALDFARLNHVRARLYKQARWRGYTLVSYVSSRASVWSSVTVGDNCFILEQNVIHPFATIGNNVTLWSGNVVGSGATIGDHAYLTSHVVVGDHAQIGEYSVLDANATVRRETRVAPKCLIGPGTVIAGQTHEHKMYYPSRTTGERDIALLSGRDRENFWPHEDPPL